MVSSVFSCSLFLLASLVLCNTAIGIRQERNFPFNEAIEFLDAAMSPSDCNAAAMEYADIQMGCGGGFAAHFQLAASEWLRASAFFKYKVPVLILGRIIGYSDGPECSHVNHDWTCYFKPVSKCQDQLLKTGIKKTIGYHAFNESVIPEQFKQYGLAWWWGVVQKWMFRLQPSVENFVEKEAQGMNGGLGFPYGRAIAGLHIRHGDKSSDGFKLHSFEAEINAVRKSPECLPQDTVTPVAGQGVCLVDSGSKYQRNVSLPVFVASDDPFVLRSAKELGHLVDAEGISQQTSTAGMFKTLLGHPEMGFNASMEIITDLHFLSQCSSLAGIAASQVYRMAVAMSNATNTLRYAVAMDYSQLPKIRRMSAKYDIPLPEEFELP